MESPLCTAAELRSDPDFRLIETLSWRPGAGFAHLDRHLARMGRSALALGIRFDAAAARALLEGHVGDEALRCRLTLDAQGRLDLTSAPLGAPTTGWTLAIAEERLNSDNIWLRFKTTRRAQYDQARATLPAGVDELLFLNERDELCEGTITNLFLTLADGSKVTPPLSSGVLPGILRETLLTSGEVTERTLTLDDLQNAREIHMGNSLRGLIPTRLAA
jgi:4-amino-4-deoxychorismate lyase